MNKTTGCVGGSNRRANTSSSALEAWSPWDRGKPGLTRGANYTARDLYQILGLPDEAAGGGWFRGFQRCGSEFHVFATLRREPVGGKARAGVERRDHWDRDRLQWSAKGARGDSPQVQALVGGSFNVHVFWRESESHPFVYAGLAVAKDVRGTNPVTVLWSFPEANGLDPLSEAAKRS